METSLYLLFGFLDVLMILTCIFRIFRWPLIPFARECCIIAVVCSAESYASRMIFDIPEYDTPIQVLTIMILLWYLLKVNFYHALTLAVIGSLAYFEVAFSVYEMLDIIGHATIDDMIASAGLGTFTIQLVSQVTTVIVAFIFYKLNLGFSFVTVPPHDKKSKYNNSEKLSLTLHFIGVLIIFSTTYWINTYGGFGITTIMITELVALIFLLYFARRKEYAV